MTFVGIIAIDGPSGSGKSTVARLVADRLSLRYLDTGAMYRAVCAAAINNGIDVRDHAAVAQFVRDLELYISTDTDDQQVIAAGVDVTDQIRTTEVSEAVSEVATNLAVREELIARQRAMVAAGGIVLEGRDTTTVVAPNADVRLLITADPTSRIARRAADLYDTVDQQTLDATSAQIVIRDQRDSTVVEFHTASAGVHTIDSTHLTLDQTVDNALHFVWHSQTGHTDESISR